MTGQDLVQKKSYGDQMSNKLPKNACAYPFKAAMLMHGTPATPCCRFHKRFLAEGDKIPVDAYAATFDEIRETMMRNEWHPGCYKCKADEETKGSSMRTEANEFFDDFTDNARLEYLEITVGRKCNLACASCGPEYSDKWDKDALKFETIGKFEIENLKKIEELDLDKISHYIDTTKTNNTFKNLKYIKVTGGEPFLHQQFLRFIVKIAEVGLAPQIELEIFTNCTWWPKKADYDALVQFKKLKINVSIDGYGVVNDLLRYPSKWEKVESTLDKWIETRDEFGADKVQIATATTVNVINAPYLYEFMYWAKVIKDIDVILQTVYEPHYLSIYHWPKWYKDKLKYTIESQWSDHIKPGKLRPAKKLLLSLCESKSAEDKSYEYTDEMKRVMRYRGQLEQLKECKKFTQLIDLSAESIEEWGPGNLKEWGGRHVSAYRKE